MRSNTFSLLLILIMRILLNCHTILLMMHRGEAGYCKDFVNGLPHCKITYKHFKLLRYIGASLISFCDIFKATLAKVFM